MKSNDFQKKLIQLGVPPEDSIARERALERALVALRNRGQESPSSIWSPGRLIWLWGIPVLALVAILALTTGQKSTQEQEAADLQILSQITELFPKTLEAVFERNGEVDVQLTSAEVPISTQPLILILKKRGEVLRVLSYSGREICLELDGRNICMELLVGNDGDVIVAGQNFLWSRQNPLLLDGYEVEAKSLNVAL